MDYVPTYSDVRQLQMSHITWTSMSCLPLCCHVQTYAGMRADILAHRHGRLLSSFARAHIDCICRVACSHTPAQLAIADSANNHSILSHVCLTTSVCLCLLQADHAEILARIRALIESSQCRWSLLPAVPTSQQCA